MCHAWSDDVLKAVGNQFRPCKKQVRDRLHQCLLIRQLDKGSQSLHDGISGKRARQIESQQTEDLKAQTHLKESSVDDSSKNYANDIGHFDAGENVEKHGTDVGNSVCLKARCRKMESFVVEVVHLDGKAFSENKVEVLVSCEETLDTSTVGHQFQPCKEVVQDNLYRFLMDQQLHDNIQNVMTEKSSNILEKENCNAGDFKIQGTRTRFLSGRVTDDQDNVKKSVGKLRRRKLTNTTQSSEVLVVEHLDDETFRDTIVQDLSKSSSIHGVTYCTGVDTKESYFRPCKEHVRDQLHQLLMSRKLNNSFQYSQNILADSSSLQLVNCNQEREHWKVEDFSRQMCTEEDAVAQTFQGSCSEKLQYGAEKLEHHDHSNIYEENHFYATADDCKKSVGDECFSQPDKFIQEVKCLPTAAFNSGNCEIDKENYSEKSFLESERTVEFCSVKLDKRSPSIECLPVKDIMSEADIKEEDEEIDSDQANWEHSFCLEKLACKTESVVEHDTVTLEERVTDSLDFSNKDVGNFCCIKAEIVDDRFQLASSKNPVRDQLYHFLMARRLGDQLQHVPVENKDETRLKTENSSQETNNFQTEDFNCNIGESWSLAEVSSCATDLETFRTLHVKEEVQEVDGSQFQYANYENGETINKDHEKSKRDDINIDFTLHSNWSREVQCLNAADFDNETDAKDIKAKVLVTTDESADNLCSSIAEKLDIRTRPCIRAVRDQLHHLLMSRLCK